MSSTQGIDKSVFVKHILDEAVGYIARWAWKYRNSAGIQRDTGGCHSKAMHLCGEDAFNLIEYFASAAAKPRSEYKGESAGYVDNVQEYLEWLYTEDSPWWNLHKGDIEIIRDSNNDIRGFIAGPSVFKLQNRSYFFNFLIANRMVRDHFHQFRNFKDLKNVGLSNFQAFLLSPYLRLDPKTNQWNKYSEWNAAHTPIREALKGNVFNSDGYFNPSEKQHILKILDIDRFRRGDFDSKAGTPSLSSYGWLREGNKNDITLGNAFNSATSAKTKFSQVPTITNERILEFATTLPE